MLLQLIPDAQLVYEMKANGICDIAEMLERHETSQQRRMAGVASCYTTVH